MKLHACDIGIGSPEAYNVGHWYVETSEGTALIASQGNTKTNVFLERSKFPESVPRTSIVSVATSEISNPHFEDLVNRVLKEEIKIDPGNLPKDYRDWVLRLVSPPH